MSLLNDVEYGFVKLLDGLKNAAGTLIPLPKFSGSVTWSGGGASLATVITGVAVGDIAVVTITNDGTQNSYLLTAACTANTLTVVISTANTSNDLTFSYLIFRGSTA